MWVRLVLGVAIVAVILGGMQNAARGRDLASISWKEFAAASELVFEGRLMKAEILGDGVRDSKVRCTYKVAKVFKGEEVKEVTFDAPLAENINKTVGRLAVVALKKERDQWVLSVDERSVWSHENKMGANFLGVSVFEVPTGLLRDVPEVLSEEVVIKVPHGKEYRDEKVRVFLMERVERELKGALGE